VYIYVNLSNHHGKNLCLFYRSAVRAVYSEVGDHVHRGDFEVQYKKAFIRGPTEAIPNQNKAETMSDKKKIIDVCTVECPHYAGIIEVKKEVEVITPATPANKKERFFTEKSVQTTLSISQE